MSIIESVILGLVQGLTEFLPVSSSGHLLIVRELLGMSLTSSLQFDVLLHLATLLAIIIYFGGDIKRIITDAFTQGLSMRSSKLLWAIIVGSIPAGVAGFVYGDKIEQVFRSSESVALALIAGSILFFLADRISRNKGGVGIVKGFFIGIFQSFALIPGISRSGSTISGGLIFGLSREESIKFAFLLGIPVILGAGVKTLMDIGISNFGDYINTPVILGFFVAFFSGLWAIRFLVKFLSKNSFTPFIVYRLVLAGAILLFL